VWDQPELSTTLTFDHPPHLAQTLTHARMGAGDPCVQIVDGCVWRATRTPEGLATQRIHLRADRAVQVDAWGPGSAWVITRAHALCGGLDDPRAFAPQHGLLERLTRYHPGLRIGRTDAVFETALAVTLEQRVATHDAWASWRYLVHALGERAPGPFQRLWAPPAADRVARTPYEMFHRFGIERRRADVLKRLGVVARRLEETATLSLERAYARFRAIPGVGPWTAARIGAIALGDPDAVAVGDLHLPHMVTWVLAGERPGTDERMLELLEPFRGHRGRVIRLLLAGGPMRTAARA
jgi:3-methyladenine DNA glycosylase/8-oxoguanine DNA glycosylase